MAGVSMPIGKARERWRGRRPKPVSRDPKSTEAYEEGWYALLARQASADDDQRDPADDPPDAAVPTGSAQPGRPQPNAPDLASVTPLVIPRTRAEQSERRPASVPRVRAVEPSSSIRPDATSLRIGVRKLPDPETVYLEYLTASRHREYFRAELWRDAGPITPVHLWRANHLGAGWDVAAVERFMDVAASLAADLIAAAPRTAPPGHAERRLWTSRFLTADWVRAFGLARVSKTLHAMLPELVPDLDAEMMPWARRVWLGLGDPSDADDVSTWIETCEALEDVLVLRAQQLGHIVRRLRRLTPALGPLGRLGPVMAAFWQGYWAETAPRRPAPEEPATPAPEPATTVEPRKRGPRAAKPATADTPAAATGRSRATAKEAPPSGLPSPAKRTTTGAKSGTTRRTKRASTSEDRKG